MRLDADCGCGGVLGLGMVGIQKTEIFQERWDQVFSAIL